MATDRSGPTPRATLPDAFPDAQRAYRVLGLVGRGGHGAVYRAELRGAEGFRKEVAVKLLSDADPSEAVLGRFRDEARLLGLLRDRAIVSVDPPVRLNGRWAVVMEYVDGCSLRALVRAVGPLPPELALQIVAEVARALGKAWSQPGPDGVPLHLLHRDIKPSNLQLTPSGEVKILDFGIAKAATAPREAETGTDQLLGTVGYVAPERFVGQEVEATDMFSLGVVLWNLLSGAAPDPEVASGAGPRDDAAPLEVQARWLATCMMTASPSARPTPREVEREAKRMSRLGSADLREWAEHHVAPSSPLEPDALVGSILTDTLPVAQTQTRALAATAVLAGGTSVALLGGALAAAAAAVVLLVWVAWTATRPVQTAGTPPIPPELAGAVGPAPDPAPPPGPSAPPLPPTPVAPAPQAPVAVAPAAPRPAQPVVEARPPVPAPRGADPVVAEWQRHTFGSSPIGVRVWVDGQELGVTPITTPSTLAPGRHSLAMTLGADRLEATFTVSTLTPRNHVCRFSEHACF